MPTRCRSSAGRLGLLLASCLALASHMTASASTGLLGALPETVYTTDCATGATFCLSAAGETTVYANGRIVETEQVCAERDYLQLDVTAAYEGLGTGPYQVIWKVGPSAFRTRLTDRDSLLHFLQRSTPAANWRRGDKGHYRGLPDEGPGELTIADAETGAYHTATFDTIAVATDRSYLLPVGTHQLIAETPDGTDTTVLHVLCTPTTRRDVRIVAGLRGSHCLPADAPPDTYDVVVLEAPSPTLVGNAAVLGLCLELEGLATGKTTGLYERTHRPSGARERFEVRIEVIPAGDVEAPAPRDDYAALAHNGQGAIDVLVNDEVPGTTNSVVISQSPDGQARVDAKFRIHYSAPEGWCGRDSLRYVVCNEGGCEEALVRIEVACEKLIPFSGFSPNGDGVNDAFTVLGLENYPDNTVVIFNEYGHPVFQATGYANDWEGTSKGSPLTEGTYYYVVQARGFRTLSGYVQLQR